jgi:hypothetical protein
MEVSKPHMRERDRELSRLSAEEKGTSDFVSLVKEIMLHVGYISIYSVIVCKHKYLNGSSQLQYKATHILLMFHRLQNC